MFRLDYLIILINSLLVSGAESGLWQMQFQTKPGKTQACRQASALIPRMSFPVKSVSLCAISSDCCGQTCVCVCVCPILVLFLTAHGEQSNIQPPTRNSHHKSRLKNIQSA